MFKPTRYHPLLVAIHWVSALLIVFMLLFGTFVLARTPNNADKLLPLTMHAFTGIIILVLTVIRLIIRLTRPKPERATTGNEFPDFIGVVTHWLLYLGALGMGLSGLGIAVQAGLFQMIFTGNWALTGGFYLYPPRIGHHYIALALDAIILLHIGAALFHQIIRKDNLIAGGGRLKEFRLRASQPNWGHFNHLLRVSVDQNRVSEELLTVEMGTFLKLKDLEDTFSEMIFLNVLPVIQNRSWVLYVLFCFFSLSAIYALVLFAGSFIPPGQSRANIKEPPPIFDEGKS